MQARSLAAWMARLSLNKVQAASLLGISRATLDRYLNNVNAIPRKIELACKAIESALKNAPQAIDGVDGDSHKNDNATH